MKNLDSNGFGKRPDPQNVDKEVLRLWNPTAAILWGLLFSPAFSALLHSKNWAALGKEDKAKESMQWAISGIVIILLLTFSDVLLGIKIPDAVGNVFPLIYLGSWYFPLGREQSKYLKNEIDGNYKKRGWFKPIIIATVAMFIFFQLILLTVNPIGNADISDKTKVGLNKEVSKEITEKRVFEILKNKVNKGNATANEHYALGYIYENGIGVPVDYKKAMKQYKLSAKQGDAKSQALLGYKYYKGKSTPVDYKKAMKWFKLSAEQGNANAQGMLGSIYYKGEGVPVDYKKAIKWSKLSAEQGEVNAQLLLGSIYYKGEGVPVDYKEAMKWIKLSAEQGEVNSQGMLGVMYTAGQGTPINKKIALKWFKLSAEQGNAASKKILSTLNYTK